MKKEEWFQDFPIPSYEEWREAAEQSLKGASFEKKLLTRTYEGITLQPIYRKEDVANLSHLTGLPGIAPYVRGTRALGYGTCGWEVNQEISVSSPEAFQRAAMHDLARGQTMLNLVLDQASLEGRDPESNTDAVGSDQTGVSIFTPTDLDIAFAGISLEKVPLYMHTGGLALPMVSLLLAHMEHTGENPEKLRGMVGADPLGTLAQAGQLPCSLETAYHDMAEVTRWADRHAPRLRTIHVLSHPYHNGGANAVQDLSFSLAVAVEYIRALLKRGLSIEKIAGKIQFSFSIGSNVFMEIARLRAARLLWATIVGAFGGSAEAQKMNIHGRTSAWSKTVLDSYVNMLRASTEAFSAIVGGADSLHVSPFDEAIGPADEFSRRIARNTQLILREEAHLDRVADPAGGSWYVEWLTDAVAEKAWKLFQKVEEQGGMKAALESGFVQQQIDQMAAEKAENIAQRTDRIVGTNMYPDTAEPIPAGKNKKDGCDERLALLQTYRRQYDQAVLGEKINELRQASSGLLEKALEAARAGATLGDLTQAMIQEAEQPVTVKPIRSHRAAEAFEALRRQTQSYRDRTGRSPQVYLAGVGALSRYKARADFCTEFFAVGGFEVNRPDPPAANVEEAAAGALAAGAQIVVICADDESYPEVAAPLARTLKQRRSDCIVMLAGLPAPEQAAAYQAAGVDDFLHMRSNCYQMLHELQKRTGVIT